MESLFSKEFVRFDPLALRDRRQQVRWHVKRIDQNTGMRAVNTY